LGGKSSQAFERQAAQNTRQVHCEEAT
jgi:hypothetical protein